MTLSQMITPILMIVSPFFIIVVIDYLYCKIRSNKYKKGTLVYCYPSSEATKIEKIFKYNGEFQYKLENSHLLHKERDLMLVDEFKEV